MSGGEIALLKARIKDQMAHLDTQHADLMQLRAAHADAVNKWSAEKARAEAAEAEQTALRQQVENLLRKGEQTRDEHRAQQTARRAALIALAEEMDQQGDFLWAIRLRDLAGAPETR